MAQERIVGDRATSDREAAAAVAPAAPSPVHPVLELQAKIGNRATRQLIQRLSAERAPAQDERGVPASTSGQPMPEAVQRKMEGAFGAGFSDVRVHPGSARATALGAVAYTQGSDIHVAPGHWAPETTRGQELLGHELAHVVQQRAGRVQATAQTKGVSLNDSPALEAEADAMGARAARGTAGGPRAADPIQAKATASLRAPAGSSHGGVAQRARGKANSKKPPAVPGIKRRSIRKHALGTHGAKQQEQKRLTSLLKNAIKVSGSTHESEHTIGYEPLARGLKRGSGGRARRLENMAPAYQEVKALHRGHIGTGMHSTADASGFTSAEYRDTQRSLVEAGDVSSAVQINQLGYAFDPTFATRAATLEGQAAQESYNTMVENMDQVTYDQGGSDATASVSPEQKAEMYLARIAAVSGQWPTAKEIDDAKKRFGVK